MAAVLAETPLQTSIPPHMSSSIDQLFGKPDGKKVESTVDKLFNSAAKPIEDTSALKKRTVTQLERAEPVAVAEEDSESTEETALPAVDSNKKKRKRSKNDENDQLESQYYEKLMSDDGETENSLKDDGYVETVKVARAEQAKVLDLKDDELAKAERTVFVGNLANELISSKTLYKEFKKLFSTNPKEGQDKALAIDSIRFRSISFDEPLPRKVAFVQQKLHKSRDSINAYIVYKTKDAVKLVCQKLNGVEFHNRHLRVDSVSHPTKHDKQRSVFIGNLDFEEDEETLWKHFATCGPIEYVRIVRDSKTNVGKGFAYVQFKQLETVSKALLLNDKPMKSASNEKKKARKLRVSRCKNIKKTAAQDPRNESKYDKLNETQKTRFGRAKRVLGKADKATLGKELTIEGMRASKNDKQNTLSHLKKRKQRSKTGRVTKRSIAYKKKLASGKE